MKSTRNQLELRDIGEAARRQYIDARSLFTALDVDVVHKGVVFEVHSLRPLHDQANPTRIEFGKGKEANIGQYVKKFGAGNVLVLYGSERIKKSGLHFRFQDVKCMP